MRRFGESDETFGTPPTAVERYYGCPRCGLQRAYDIRRNAFLARRVQSVSAPLGRSGSKSDQADSTVATRGRARRRAR